MFLVQSFLKKTKSILVVIKDFDDCLSFIAKHIQTWIHDLNAWTSNQLQAQSIDGLTHVCMPQDKIYGLGRIRKHGSLPGKKAVPAELPGPGHRGLGKEQGWMLYCGAHALGVWMPPNDIFEPTPKKFRGWDDVRYRTLWLFASCEAIIWPEKFSLTWWMRLFLCIFPCKSPFGETLAHG